MQPALQFKLLVFLRGSRGLLDQTFPHLLRISVPSWLLSRKPFRARILAASQIPLPNWYWLWHTRPIHWCIQEGPSGYTLWRRGSACSSPFWQRRHDHYLSEIGISSLFKLFKKLKYIKSYLSTNVLLSIFIRYKHERVCHNSSSTTSGKPLPKPSNPSLILVDE